MALIIINYYELWLATITLVNVYITMENNHF